MVAGLALAFHGTLMLEFFTRAAMFITLMLLARVMLMGFKQLKDPPIWTMIFSGISFVLFGTGKAIDEVFFYFQQHINLNIYLFPDIKKR